MNSNTNYNEWSREQKDEFARQRMLSMKSKNAMLMQRHAEVEQDRIKAEEHNSSITSISKVIPKKGKQDYVLESNETKEKTQYVREWDRGKSDKEYWESPDYHPSYRSHKSSHFERRGEFNDNLRNYSRAENKFGDASDGFKSKSRRENYHKNTSSSYHMGPKTGREEYQNNESRWTSQKTYPDEKYRKDDYKGSNSKRNLNKTWSHSYTSSSSANLSNLKKLEKSAWWPNNKCTDETKYDIVKNWVTSVYISNNLNQPAISKENKEEIDMPEKSYSKFDRFEHSPNRSDDDNAGLSQSFMHGQKLDVSGNQVFHENENKKTESIKKSLFNTNERGYVKKSDKYSSEAHSGGYNKNENVRKQRRFEKKEIRNDFKESFTGNKVKDPKSMADDSWSNSVLPKYDKLGCHNDSNYHKKAACNDDEDGLWSNTEQSDIQWKLSDDESKNHESVKKIVSPKAGLGKKGCSEMFSPQRSKIAKPDDEKNSDAGWSTVSEEGELPNTDIHERRKKRS